MFLFRIILCVTCLIKTEEVLMLKPLDFLCSTSEVEVILSGKRAGHEEVRSGASSEPPLYLSRKRISHVSQRPGPSSAAPGGEATLCQCALLQAFYCALRLYLPFLSFAKLFCFAWSPWSEMSGSFFPKGEQVLCKRLPRHRDRSGF